MSVRLTNRHTIGQIYGREHILAELESSLRMMEREHDVDWATLEFELEREEIEESAYGGNIILDEFHTLSVRARGTLRDEGQPVRVEP